MHLLTALSGTQLSGRVGLFFALLGSEPLFSPVSWVLFTKFAAACCAYAAVLVHSLSTYSGSERSSARAFTIALQKKEKKGETRTR
jgi:predicted protein tyrosine phosphatase